MYLGIDIGGTKTLVACLDKKGMIVDSYKFPTPPKYPDFLKELAATVANMPTKDLVAAGVAVPGKVDRKHGVAIAFGNIGWQNVPIERDIRRMLKCPVVIENDANLAGLSEAMLIKQYDCVLYVTISTGIGTGIITHQVIDPDFMESEGGQILLEHKGKLQTWEDFASGSAIVRRFGKKAGEINDQKTWRIIAQDIAIGLYDLVTFIQPDVVVLGGGVLEHYEKLEAPLQQALQHLATPLTPIPPIRRAARPDEAVVYGCYDLAKSVHGNLSS